MSKVIETTGMMHCNKCDKNFMIGLEKLIGDQEWVGAAFCPFCGVEQEHITIPAIPLSTARTYRLLSGPPITRQIQNSKKGVAPDAISEI